MLATASVAGARIQSGKEKDSMFADIAKVFIKSGKGGNGHVSFRRELYVPARWVKVLNRSSGVRRLMGFMARR